MNCLGEGVIMKLKLDKKYLQNGFVIALLALFACCLWGSAFPSIKLGYRMFHIAEEDIYGKMLFAGVRFFISGCMVFLFSFACKISVKVTKEQFVKLLMLGILQTSLQYFFFYIGMANTSGTTGSILSSLATFFSVLLAPCFFPSDRLSVRKIAGVVVGFAGIIILNYQGATSAFRLNGEGFIIISSAVSAFASIYTKKLTELKIHSVLISAYQLLLGGLFLGMTGFIGNGGEFLAITLSGSLLLIYMGFISAAAFSIWTILLSYNSVGAISIYKFSIPLFGSLLSFLILNERNLNLSVLFSMIFVAAGILLINFQSKSIDKKKIRE